MASAPGPTPPPLPVVPSSRVDVRSPSPMEVAHGSAAASAGSTISSGNTVSDSEVFVSRIQRGGGGVVRGRSGGATPKANPATTPQSRAPLCCRGACVLRTSDDRLTRFVTWVIVVGPVALYASLLCGPLWHVHPALPVIGCCLGAATITMLLCTNFMNPGVLPRGVYAPDVVAHLVAMRVDVNAAPGTVQVPNQVRVPAKNGSGDSEAAAPTHYTYCDVCDVYRRARSRGHPGDFHCTLCNHCVAGMDHHCAWVGTCIGARNKAMFDNMQHVAGVTALYLAVTAIVRLVYAVMIDSGRSFGEWLDDSLGEAVGLLSCLVLALLFTCWDTRAASYLRLLCIVGVLACAIAAAVPAGLDAVAAMAVLLITLPAAVILITISLLTARQALVRRYRRRQAARRAAS